MYISTETNKEKLEAMAYQQVKLLNQAQQNLQILEARITELGKEVKPEKK
jgi:hypothetical protein